MVDELYRNFRYQVRNKGRLVAGFSTLTSEDLLQPFDLRPGKDQTGIVPIRPGRSADTAFRLERGCSWDSDFIDWAEQDWSDPDHADGTRRTIWIDACDETGAVVVTWTVYNTWVSRLSRLSDPESIGAPAGAVAIEWMILQNEGWSRSR